MSHPTYDGNSFSHRNDNAAMKQREHKSKTTLKGKKNCRTALLPGTDVMILKIFSTKNLAKKLAFLTQNKA
jgi:hypothetical protein